MLGNSLYENQIKNEISELEIESLKQLEYFSVLSKISTYTYSELGRNIIEKTLPKNDLLWLNREHSLINEMIELITTDDFLPIEGLNDVKTKFHKSKIENAVLNTNEILNIKDTIRVSRLIKQYFKSRNEKFTFLYDLTSSLHENRMLEKHIEEAIDDTGEIRDNASKELSRIRREIKEHGARLRNRLEKILKKTVEDAIVQDDFYSIREGRFVLPIKASNKRTLPGIIHGISQTGQTVYLEPTEIIEMNNNLSILQNEELREIHRILTNLTSEIGDNSESFLYSIDILALVDSLIAKAKYALDFGGIKPEIIDKNEIYLGKIYHPILRQKLTKKQVIPLSIEFQDDKRGHLISGPNAGGKTVALKSIGLNLAMALSGIFPFGECKTNYRKIYTSIGDHQSIDNNLSTFSSQLTSIKSILSEASKSSLVLIDEILSGTDPQEGSALACGILDTFLEYQLFFIVTTHQSSLKTYALNKNVIANASLEFDEINLKPSYKFLSGIPGNSYAFHLARSIGMAANVIQRAESYLGSKQQELEESIAMLSKYRFEAETSKIELDRLKLETEKIKNDYEGKLKEIKEKKKEYVETAQRDAYQILQNANKLIENTIREVKEGVKSAGEIKKEFDAEKKNLASEVEKIERALPKTGIITKENLEIGDYVTMEDGISTGMILEIEKDNKTATVEFNGLKFKIKLKKLKISEAPKEKKYPMSKQAEHIKFDAAARIDLRGMRADEALKAIDVFINEAVLGNMPFATIIHGKGTGALRVAVQEFLKYNHSVSSFRDGEISEGGAGVTVIEF